VLQFAAKSRSRVWVRGSGVGEQGVGGQESGDRSQRENVRQLLMEIERQRAVLAELPKDYESPLFDSRQAVELQRKSGYKNTASGAREIIDNAFEAGDRR
jgi:hypothetical protein